MAYHTQYTTLAELHRLGAQAEPIGQSWLRAYADRLEINTYAVEGLLGMARDGATLEALAERHAAIRTAVSDPKRLERAGWVFTKVLDGEKEVWPTRPNAISPSGTVSDKPRKTVSETFLPSPTQKPEVPDRDIYRRGWGKRPRWGGR